MQQSEVFHYNWAAFMGYASLTCLSAGLLVFLFHEFRLALMRDPKRKYDYLNQNEIRNFWVSALLMVISGSFFINTLGSKIVVSTAMIGLVIRMFISVAFFAIAYTLLRNLISVYYPSYLEKKLQYLRNKPRISPAGNVMRRLSESEEDIHLDEGMQIEERFFSVDYDVWIDEKTGFRKIEKYRGFSHAEQCPECDYYTLKPDWEKINVPPTQVTSGIMSRHYTCAYCGHKETREFDVARLSTNVISNAPA
jgi:hypothetical protein